MDERKSKEVKCAECGAVCAFEVVSEGWVSGHPDSKFLCRACREVVLERRIEEKNLGNRKLLID